MCCSCLPQAEEQLKLVMLVDVLFMFAPGGGAVEAGGGTTTDVGTQTEVGGRRAAESEARTRSHTEQEERSATTLILSWWQVVINSVTGHSVHCFSPTVPSVYTCRDNV